MRNDECGMMNEMRERLEIHHSSLIIHHFLSPQLQSRETQQREQYRDDQEAEDDLRLLPARHLEVVVQRRHLKQPPARTQAPLRQFEEGDLQRHRQRLDDIDAADEYEYQLLMPSLNRALALA